MNQTKPKVHVRFIPDDSVALYYKGIFRPYSSSTPQFQNVENWLKDKEAGKLTEDEVQANLVNLFEEAKKPRETKDVNAGFVVDVNNGQVSVNGRVLPSILGKRLLQHQEKGLPYKPILACWDRLVQNTSYRAVENLYAHLDKYNHPLLEDGRFVAWKRVSRSEDGKLVDFYTGTFDNSVGATPTMPRNEVDEDPRHSCSRGLHIANYHYAVNFYQGGCGAMIEVAIDPKDVVAIPYEYDGKMRVCHYEVLSVCDVEDKSLVSGHMDDPSFRVDPDQGRICPECNNHYDFCDCPGEDDDEDPMDLDDEDPYDDFDDPDEGGTW